MTGDTAPAPITVDDESGRPRAPKIAALTIVAAALAAMAAVAAFGWTSVEGWQLLISVALIVGGAVLARAADDDDVRRARVLGRWVLMGIGAAGAVLGAYLAANALLALMTPDPPILRGEEDSLPSPVVILLVLYGVPALALFVLSAKENRAGTVGLGLVLPLLVVSVLGAAEAGPLAIAVVTLVVALGAIPLAARAEPDSRAGTLWLLFGVMAASFTVGAGLAPVGSAATGRTTDPAGEPVPADLQPVLLIGGLAAAAVLLILAALRRDGAAGVVGAAIFAVPPTIYLIPTAVDEPGVAFRDLAPAVIPVIVLAIALAAVRVPALRAAILAALPQRIRPAAVTTEALVVVAASAAVVFVVHAMPRLELPAWLHGLLALLVLAGCALLALRYVSGLAGTILAGVTLIGLALATPWWELIYGWPGPIAALQHDNWLLIGSLGLVTAAGAAWLLVRRYRHPGVWAAATYLLAGALAEFLLTLLDAVGPGVSPFFGDDPWSAVIILLGPLLLLGIAAAVAALRGGRELTAIGQAVGAVVLLAGVAIGLRILIAEIGSSLDDVNDSAMFAMQSATGLLAPTDVALLARSLQAGTAAVVALSAMLVLLLVLLVSTVRRASAPLTAAGVAGIVLTAQIAALTTSSVWDAETTEGLLWALAGVAAVLCAVAAVATVAAGRERSEV